MNMNSAAERETVSLLRATLTDLDFRAAEEAASVWLMKPDYDELEALSMSLIERDARRLGQLLDLLLSLGVSDDSDRERVYRVLDDLRDRIEIDHDQPASERWKADRTFDLERMRERMAQAGAGGS